jgi:tetratricopeptide (TPR) repeat protein
LKGGKRGTSDRHATLHATIAWSYDLLDPSERHVFESAAVINGEFSLDDLLAVATDERFDRATVLAATAALAEKSLVVVEMDGESARRRYRLLESTRAFGLEVAEARENGAALARAHRRWGRYLSDRLRRSIEDYRGPNAVPIGDAHLDHVRGYLDWSIEKRHDVAAGTALASEIHLLWDISGLHDEGIRFIEAGLAALEDGEAHAPVAMIGWYAVSRLNGRLVRPAKSLAPGLRAYELAAHVGNDAIRASSANKIAFAYDAMGETEKALAYAEEAVSLFERVGDEHSAAFSACTAAVIALKIRGKERGLEALRVAVERQRALGDGRRTASAELYLGEAYYVCGDTDAAIASISDAIVEFRKTASRFELAVGLGNLGTYLTAIGRGADARPIALEALRIGREGAYRRFIALAAQTCATIAALEGREVRCCAQVLGYVSHRYGSIGEIGYTETSAQNRLRSALTGRLSDDEFARAIREGEAFDDEAAIETALRCVSRCG